MAPSGVKIERVFGVGGSDVIRGGAVFIVHIFSSVRDSKSVSFATFGHTRSSAF